MTSSTTYFTCLCDIPPWANMHSPTFKIANVLFLTFKLMNVLPPFLKTFVGFSLCSFSISCPRALLILHNNDNNNHCHFQKNYNCFHSNQENCIILTSEGILEAATTILERLFHAHCLKSIPDTWNPWICDSLSTDQFSVSLALSSIRDCLVLSSSIPIHYFFSKSDSWCSLDHFCSIIDF